MARLLRICLPFVIIGLMGGCGATQSRVNPDGPVAPQLTDSGRPAGSSQQIAYSQNLLNRYGYRVDASQLSLDQHIRLRRIDVWRQLPSRIRFEIEAVLRRTD